MTTPVERRGARMPRLRLAAWALLIVGVAAAVRLPALAYRGPIDDEGIYAVVANEMLDGGRPYVDAIERKPPLLFWTYEAVTRLGGEYNWPALHDAALVWILLTATGLFFAGRQVAGDAAGLAAALLYVLFESWGTWRNYAWNGEALMNLPIAWAWAIAFRRPRSRLRVDLAAAGALVAAACLLKQPAGIVIAALAGYVLLPSYRASREITVGDAIGQTILIGVGFVAVLLGAAAVLHAEGLLRDAIYWSVLDHDVPHVFWRHGLAQTAAFAAACLPLLVGAAATLGRDAIAPAERHAIWLFLAVSAIGTAASGRFYVHYYVQVILPLSLAAGPFFAMLVVPDAGASHSRRRLWSAYLAATAAAFLLIGAAGLRAAPVTTEAGRYIESHSRPADRMFVWGQRPRIYLDARRRPASRYVATFALTGFIFGEPLPGVDTRARILPEAWPNLLADFGRHPPRYVLDTENAAGARYPIREFPVLSSWIADNCTLATRVAEGDLYRCQAGEGVPAR